MANPTADGRIYAGFYQVGPIDIRVRLGKSNIAVAGIHVSPALRLDAAKQIVSAPTGRGVPPTLPPACWQSLN